jgi:hypothetical protein
MLHLPELSRIAQKQAPAHFPTMLELIDTERLVLLTPQRGKTDLPCVGLHVQRRLVAAGAKVTQIPQQKWVSIQPELTGRWLPSAIASTIRGDRNPSRISHRTERPSSRSRFGSSATDCTRPEIKS